MDEEQSRILQFKDINGMCQERTNYKPNVDYAINHWKMEYTEGYMTGIYDFCRKLHEMKLDEIIDTIAAIANKDIEILP